MALAKASKKKPVKSALQDRLIHYRNGIEDVEKRKNRKNGWDQVINAYMNKLPGDWPYTSKVTDPRIRTTILEKTARLLNSKLQGRLVPREGGDVVKARINNAILDYQWDNATNGGSMIEKVAVADQHARLFGASFALVYWDNEKNCNEIKIIDPRDIWFDRSADHVRNAKWVQYREYTTLDELASRGYETKRLRERIKSKSSVNRDEHSMVKQNRGLEEAFDDPANPVVELITELTRKVGNKPSRKYCFLPRYNELLEEADNPYKHQQINVSQLRYYPLGDDIYGESEVEPVISLKRAIDAVLCGFIDTMNLAMRPPIKLLSSEQRMSTVVYNPGARWILNNLQSGQEVRIGEGAIAAFNNTYPALVNAFNTAMGDQSLGVSAQPGRGFADKTATEVRNLENQQNSRDQYNQLYLAEFLKDIMLMWLANNQQYLFDDPTKKFEVVKIVGREAVKNMQQLQLDQYEQDPEAMAEIEQTIVNTGGIPDVELSKILGDTQVPKFPVIKNPTADTPDEYEIIRKLDVKDSGMEADLYLTPDDLHGVYDYVPDVKSMAAGAGKLLQEARKLALQTAKEFREDLMAEGQKLKVSELLINVFEDAGYKDAESLFEAIQTGPGLPGGGELGLGADPAAGLQAPPGVPVPAGGPGMAQPPQVQEAGIPQPGIPG